MRESRRCDELVTSVPEATTPPTVAGRHDEQRHTDDGTDDGTCDRAGVGFATISTAAYFFSLKRMYFAPIATLRVKRWAFFFKTVVTFLRFRYDVNQTLSG